MADFKPIESQEALDAIIKRRLEQKEMAVRSEYADYEDLKKQSQTWEQEKQQFEKTIADNKTAYDELNSKYAAATGKVEELERSALRTKVAIDKGIPIKLKDFLKGNTEAEIVASAEELGKFAGTQPAPLADPEGDPPSEKDAAMRELVHSLHS